MSNILFVLYHDFSANSAVHVHNFANRLAALGHATAVAIPNGADTGRSLGQQDYSVRRFAEIDGNAARPCFVWSEKRTKITTGAHQDRACAFSIQNGGGQVKAADLARVRRVDVAGVAEHHAFSRDAEPLEIIVIARPREENFFVRARPENEFRNFGRHKSIEPIHDHGDAGSGRDEAAILARMRQVRGDFNGMGPRQFFERSAQVYFEYEFLVVFEVNEKCERAKTREFLAE